MCQRPQVEIRIWTCDHSKLNLANESSALHYLKTGGWTGKKKKKKGQYKPVNQRFSHVAGNIRRMSSFTKFEHTFYHWNLCTGRVQAAEGYPVIYNQTPANYITASVHCTCLQERTTDMTDNSKSEFHYKGTTIKYTIYNNVF